MHYEISYLRLEKKFLVFVEVGSSAYHGPKFPGLGKGGDSGGFGSYVWQKGATPEAQQTSM
jgi:hypothetical protein